MKKKGFTLTELLAVIVVLSVIALIATPLILNVIEKVKIGALESSVNGLVESANMYYTNEIIKGENLSETIFEFVDGEQTSTKKLKYKGKVYNGKLILHDNGEVALCIDDEEHYAYKNKDNDEIISGVGTCLYDGTTGDFSSNSSIRDFRGKTVVATNVSKSENGLNTLITIPKEGHYDETSIISVPIETIKNEVSSFVNKIPIISITENTSKIWAGDATKIIDGNIDISHYSNGVYGGSSDYLMFVFDLGSPQKINYLKKYAYNGGSAGVYAGNRIVVMGSNNSEVLTKFNSCSELDKLVEINLLNESISLIPLSNDLPFSNNNIEYRYYLIISYNAGEHQSIIEIEAYK